MTCNWADRRIFGQHGAGDIGSVWLCAILLIAATGLLFYKISEFRRFEVAISEWHPLGVYDEAICGFVGFDCGLERVRILNPAYNVEPPRTVYKRIEYAILNFERCAFWGHPSTNYQELPLPLMRVRRHMFSNFFIDDIVNPPHIFRGGCEHINGGRV